MSVQSDDFPKTSPSDPAQPAAPQADGAQSDPPTDDLETLRAELGEIEQKADEYLRLAQRTQADFVNYRRRIEEERVQQATAASLNFVLRLLPVIDDFERVIANATPAELESTWGKGIQLVERNLRKVLEAEDVQRIAADGADFDPREHEALGRAPSADVPEGHVLHVVRPGYRKGDRVIRPAQVIVAARPA
jgi:molecular chaperone GrpE